MIPADVDVAELFHENTKITPFENRIDLAALPAPLDRGLSLARIALPRVVAAGGMGLEEAIVRRVSSRQFDPTGILPLETLSRLLAFSCGFTAPAAPGGTPEFHRAAPSAGATYPLEVYPIVFRVGGLAPGVYHYCLPDHSVELLRAGSFQQQLATWTLYQPYLGHTSAAFVLAGFTERINPRYGERGYRYTLFEAGHIAQNLHLLAAAYGLGALCVGGFVDLAISRLIGIDGAAENPLYIVAVGIRG